MSKISPWTAQALRTTGRQLCDLPTAVPQLPLFPPRPPASGAAEYTRAWPEQGPTVPQDEPAAVAAGQGLGKVETQQRPAPGQEEPTMIDILIEAPLPPRGKGRPRAAVVGGHAHVFTPAETRRWEAQLASLAQAQLPRAVIEGPVRVDILAVVGRPQHLLKRWAKPRPEGHGPDRTWAQPLGLLWRTSKPDRDNVEKAVVDALKSFWRDDAQVCCGEPLSAYAEVDGRARVVVRIRTAVGDVTEVARRLGLVA